MVIFDISPEVSESLAVFPGDEPFRREVSLDFAKGDNLHLSSMRGSLHAGAHADAPKHYHAQGQSIDQRPLERYYGECQVISVEIPRGRRIVPEDLGDVRISARRVLFRTGSFPDPTKWNSDFNSLSPELVHDLARQDVFLIGIDTPSIDPEDSKALESHQAVFHHDLSVLEGLVLEDVPDGLYKLIALPLKLKGADASPVRAILVKEF